MIPTGRKMVFDREGKSAESAVEGVNPLSVLKESYLASAPRVVPLLLF